MLGSCSEVEEISLPHVLQRLDMTPEQVCTGLHWGHGAGCCMDPTASWRRTDACTGDTCTAESVWGSFTTSLCWGGLQQGDGGVCPLNPALLLGQFVDLCILLGCDYCGKVRGLGPKKALRLLRQHGSIEQLLQHLDPQVLPGRGAWGGGGGAQ